MFTACMDQQVISFFINKLLYLQMKYLKISLLLFPCEQLYYPILQSIQ